MNRASNMQGDDSPQCSPAKPWRAVALTWPVDHNGIATSCKVIAGIFATCDEALAAAKVKFEEIGGVGFTAEMLMEDAYTALGEPVESH